MRQDLLLAPMQEPIAIGNIVARSSGERYLGLLEQKREVAAAAIDPEPFIEGVKIDDAAIKAYYDANTSAFQTPELAKIEYLMLTQDALAAQTAPDPAEVKAQYDNNLKPYTKAEERDASHILIAVKPDAKRRGEGGARRRRPRTCTRRRRPIRRSSAISPSSFRRIRVRRRKAATWAPSAAATW